MSTKNSHTTADFIQWDTAMMLIRRLYCDRDYKMSLLIGCGVFFGLRISDLLRLNWEMLLISDTFEVIEKKTQKKRIIKINKEFQNHIKNCCEALNITDYSQKCFLSQKKTVYSTQRINILLKNIKAKYKLKEVEHLTSHSLRKTFGRHIFERAENNGEMALVMLSKLFNHSDINITKRYLGIKNEEILSCYDFQIFN